MELSSIVYTPLMEEEDFRGWDKQTVQFALDYPKKIKNKIKSVARKYNKRLEPSEVEDILQLTMEDIFKKDDYNSDKTEELTVETYVYSLAKNCTLRFMTDCKKREQLLVENVQKEEDKEISIFDNIADDKVVEYSYNDITLDYVCRANEHNRYLYGPDIFTIWSVQLLSMLYNKTDRKNKLLNLLGISNSELLLAADYKDGVMTQIALEVSKIGIEEAINVIKNYTYAFEQIHRAVKSA